VRIVDEFLYILDTVSKKQRTGGRVGIGASSGTGEVRHPALLGAEECTKTPPTTAVPNRLHIQVLARHNVY
jgi:hypothetical protein